MQLIPSEFIKDNIDCYIEKQATGSQKLYCILLAIMVTFIVSLPFIYMDVSIQEQGVISLDSTLLTEIYVSPHRIGYFYSKMPVKVQINSFPCNDWGMIVGEVEEISPDYFLDSPGKNAYYKVKCRLEKDYLENKNGMKSMLKKEMSVKSHFTLTRRSLFDLLYQKFNDWTNPNDTENNRYSAYEKNN